MPTSVVAILDRPTRHRTTTGEYPLGIRCVAEFAGTAAVTMRAMAAANPIPSTVEESE